MRRRVQFFASEDEFDLFSSYFIDGMRAQVFRNVMLRICEAIENTSSDVTVDMMIRGNFKIEGDEGAEI